MAEGGGQEDPINYRTGRSQPGSTQSSATSLLGSAQDPPRSAQDPHVIDLETGEWPLGSDTGQPRPQDLPTLSEPHGELAITRQQSDECAAAPADDTPSVRQVDAAESPTTQGLVISAAQEPQLNSESVNLGDSTMSVGILGGTGGTCSVSRNASAPASCSPFRRKDGTTAGAGLSPNSETPEVMDPSTGGGASTPPLGSGVEIDATEEAATPTDASAPSMPKPAENDEEDTAAGGNGTAAGLELQAATNENATAAAVAAAAAPFETLKDDQTGKNSTSQQSVRFSQTDSTVFHATGIQNSSTLQQQQQRQDQDEPVSDNRAPKLPTPTELSKPLSTSAAELVEPADPQQQDDEQQYQQQPEQGQRQDEQDINSTSDNLPPDLPQWSPEPVETSSTPAREFDTMEPGEKTPEPGEGTPEPGEGTPEPAEGMPESGEGTPEPGEGMPESGEGTPEPGEGTPEPGEGTSLINSGCTSPAAINNDNAEPGLEQQHSTHKTDRPRRTRGQQAMACLRSLFQPCAGRRPFEAD